MNKFVSYVERFMPFICRYYFNDATLKQIRNSTDLRIFDLFFFLCKNRCIDKYAFKNEYLLTLHKYYTLHKVEQTLSYLQKLTGATAIWHKLIFIDMLIFSSEDHPADLIM